MADLGLAATTVLAFIACLAGRRWPTAIASTYGLLQAAGTLVTWTEFRNANSSQEVHLSPAFAALIAGVFLGFIGSWPDLRGTIAAAASDLSGGTDLQRIRRDTTRDVRPVFEISYWEAIRAWWAIYWPTQIVALVVFGFFQWRESGIIVSAALSIALGSVCLWLVTPRVLGLANTGFHIVACGPAEEIPELDETQTMRLRLFVWWRSFAGLLLAALLVSPFDRLLGTASAYLMAALTFLFAVGPVVMIMLVGSQIEDFRVEARRPPVLEPQQPEPAVSASTQ